MAENARGQGQGRGRATWRPLNLGSGNNMPSPNTNQALRGGGTGDPGRGGTARPAPIPRDIIEVEPYTGSSPEGVPGFHYKVSLTTSRRERSYSVTNDQENGAVRRDPAQTTTGSESDAATQTVEPLITFGDSSTLTVPTKRRMIYGTRHIRADFELGTIICAVYHQPHYDLSPVGVGTRELTDTSFGPIYSKERKFAVIGLYPDHCVCLPIFSYSGRGLGSKPIEIQLNHFGVRDSKIDPIAPSPNRYNVLISARCPPYDELPPGTFHVMSNNSNMHFTYPVSFNYETPCIVEARLTRISYCYLMQAFRAKMPQLCTPAAVPTQETETTTTGGAATGGTAAAVGGATAGNG